MQEIILYAKTLPEPLIRLIKTEKVKVNEVDGIVQLIPIAQSDSGCPFLGIAADSELTVDRFLAMTHDETEIGR